MGPPLSDPQFLRSHRRDDGRTRVAGDGEAQRAPHRRCDQHPRRRRDLWPQLGLDRGAAVPAFRGLLLSGDRIRDPSWFQARGGRRAGRAQARARLSPGRDAFGPRIRGLPLRQGDRGLSDPRTRGGRRDDRRLRSRPAVPKAGRTRQELKERSVTAAYDPNNIFAKILRGEAPCVRLFEDEVSLAFMDIMPRADGHALIIPKAPARNIFDLPPADLARFAPSVQRLAQAAMKAMAAEGISVMQFNESAG